MWAHSSGTMARLVATLALMALLAIGISALPGKRVRRGYNNSGYGGGTGGYGRGSDERDASSSQEGGNGCSSENGRSSSRELAYNRDGRQPNENRGSRSFAKSSASAAASSFNENQNSRNIIL